MKNSSFIHTSFIGSLIFSITGMLLMINNHVNSANLLLLIGVVFTVAFLILSVMEINKSTKLSSNQKIVWTIGLIAFLNVPSILYYFIGRKYV